MGILTSEFWTMPSSVPFRDSKTIGDLLGGDDRIRLEVPEFQRGYSWKDKQVRAFWKDLQDFQHDSALRDGPEEYFLGPLVLQLGERQGKITKVIVLDGQQRLATATILLAAIRDFARGIGIIGANDLARDIQMRFIEKDGSYILKLSDTDREYFRETIQLNEPNPKFKGPLRTHGNIKKAYNFFMDCIRTKTAPLDTVEKVSALKDLRNIIQSDLVAACIPVKSEGDAFKIFETLNDRGLRLSTPDLLLNYLMRTADKNDRPQIRRRWTHIIERMGKRDIKKFFRHMWLSKFGDLKNKDLFTALKEYIENEETASTVFVETCADECNVYLRLLSADQSLGKGGRYAKNLLRDLDCEAAMPALLSSYQMLRPTEFEQTARLLLVFVIRYWIIAELDYSGMEDVFYQIAKDIRDQMRDKERDTNLSKRCVSYVKTTLKNAAPSEEKLKAAIPDLVFASEEEATYVLIRLAIKMETDTKELNIQLDESNLEHIFPENPRENEWGGRANQERLAEFLLHLGNLTMLGERLNNRSRNDEFEPKKVHYRKSELNMAQAIPRDYPSPQWDEVMMKDRATKLTRDILQVWDFDNASRV